jgi:hypothetical protein
MNNFGYKPRNPTAYNSREVVRKDTIMTPQEYDQYKEKYVRKNIVKQSMTTNLVDNVLQPTPEERWLDKKFRDPNSFPIVDDIKAVGNKMVRNAN